MLNSVDKAYQLGNEHCVSDFSPFLASVKDIWEVRTYIVRKLVP